MNVQIVHYKLLTSPVLSEQMKSHSLCVRARAHTHMHAHIHIRCNNLIRGMTL
jgi:hypothetical protein